MNDNRYAPPRAAVADATETSAEQSDIGLPALRLATRLLWGSLALGLLNTALEWNYLTSSVAKNQIILLLSFVLAVVAFLIYHIGRARNWARIVMLVFAVIGLPSLAGLPAIFARSPVSAVFSFVQTVLQLSALGIVFFSSARHAFSKRSSS